MAWILVASVVLHCCLMLGWHPNFSFSEPGIPSSASVSINLVDGQPPSTKEASYAPPNQQTDPKRDEIHSVSPPPEKTISHDMETASSFRVNSLKSPVPMAQSESNEVVRTPSNTVQNESVNTSEHKQDQPKLDAYDGMNPKHADQAPSDQSTAPRETDSPEIAQSGYNDILDQIRQALAAHFHYPSLARRRNWEGTVVLTLVLQPSGHISHVRVLSGSGYQLLDTAALNSIAAVGTIPGLSSKLYGRTLEVELPLKYKLQPS